MFPKSYGKQLVCSPDALFFFYCKHYYNTKEVNIFLPGMGAAIKIFERIGTLLALKSLFTGVTTISPASGLDRVVQDLLLIKTIAQFLV